MNSRRNPCATQSLAAATATGLLLLLLVVVLSLSHHAAGEDPGGSGGLSQPGGVRVMCNCGENKLQISILASIDRQDSRSLTVDAVNSNRPGAP